MFEHYNMNQLVLPLNLEVKLQENDIAFHIVYGKLKMYSLAINLCSFFGHKKTTCQHPYIQIHFLLLGKNDRRR